MSKKLPRFWAFLGEESSKTPFVKKSGKKLTLALFWPLTHPPTTGVTDYLFFGGPLSEAKKVPVPGLHSFGQNMFCCS
jgi:hypothetical protein